jgi:hypothetical protein
MVVVRQGDGLAKQSLRRLNHKLQPAVLLSGDRIKPQRTGPPSDHDQVFPFTGGYLIYRV